jgi:sterol desaturase/sphingolipid hydroxylase (fatty acid hydroxylase superfamily)
MGIRDLALALPAIFLVMFMAEAIGGHHAFSRKTFKELGFAVTSVLSNAVIAAPLIGVAVGLLFNLISPTTKGALAGIGFWKVFPVWFVAEEFAHYWIHRWSHELPWLWKFHRTHHSAEQLNATVIYRYNFFWNFMMPQTWFAAAAIHLGIPMVLIVSSLITFLVNLLTHTSYRWDLALRRVPGLDRVLNAIEKVITLPDTHHAHHGLGRDAHMTGNYAVTLFAFDVLLGTARFPHKRQARFGLPNRFDWREELFWPVIRRRR